MLFAAPAESNLRRLRDNSNKGSIEMVFQGDLKDIDPNSSTGKLVSDSNPEKVMPEERGGTGMATRAVQEYPTSENRELTSQAIQNSGHFPLEKSSSRLTDMLNGISPGKNEFHGEFVPSCLSAVPSPLHKSALPFVHLQSTSASPGSFGPCGLPHKSKSIEHHFLMTNEHLDVVGKTTWDLLEMFKRELPEMFKRELHEMFKQELLAALNTRQEELIELVEKRVESIKNQITTLNEKADSIAEKQGTIQLDLDKILSFIKQDVTSAPAAQDKKATEMEMHVKELQKTAQTLQQQQEQTFTNPGFPLPVHRSQPPNAGYYGNNVDHGRENQPSVAHMHENRTVMPTHDPHHDHRMGHNNGYGQQWGGRHGYSGRNGKEARSPYPAISPYAFGGQFNNGYATGYSAYGFSSDASDQHHS